MVPVSHGVFIVLNAIIAGAVAALAHWIGGSGVAAFAVFTAVFALACLVQAVLSGRTQVRTLRRKIAAQDELLSAFKKEFKVTRTLLNQLADSLEDVMHQRDVPPAQTAGAAAQHPPAAPATRMPRQDRAPGMPAHDAAAAVAREAAHAREPRGGEGSSTAHLDAMLSLDDADAWTSAPAAETTALRDDEVEEEMRLVAGGGGRYAMSAAPARAAQPARAATPVQPARQPAPRDDLPGLDDFDDLLGDDFLDGPESPAGSVETPALASALRETASELQAERSQAGSTDPFAFLDEPHAQDADAPHASRDALASILDELERDEVVPPVVSRAPEARAPEARAPEARAAEAPSVPEPAPAAERRPVADDLPEVTPPAPKERQREHAPEALQSEPAPRRAAPVADIQPAAEPEAPALRNRIASALNRPARPEAPKPSPAAPDQASAVTPPPAAYPAPAEPKDSTLGLPLDFDEEDGGDFVDVTARYSGRDLDLESLTAATPAGQAPEDVPPAAAAEAAVSPKTGEATEAERAADVPLSPSLSAWMEGLERPRTQAQQDAAPAPAPAPAQEGASGERVWEDDPWVAPEADSYAGDEALYAPEPVASPEPETPASRALPSLDDVLGTPGERAATLAEDDLPLEGVRRTASAFGRRGRPSAPAAEQPAPAAEQPAPQPTAPALRQTPASQPEQKAAPQIRLDVIDTLNWAIDQNAVDLFLQPIIKVPERKVHYFEGFSRVRAPDGQYVMPNRYLKPATESGLIGTIDNLLLSRCMQLVRAMKRAGRDIGVFCNISGNTLKDEVFFEEFLTFMRENRDLARSVIFEMTQATVKEAGEEEWERVRELVRLGFPLSMDNVSDWVIDFGLLARRGFRFIKVDAPTALRGMADNGAMIRPNELRDKLHQRGISLVVEKIEDEDTFKRVLACHVDYAQGYLFGAPERIDEGELG